MNEFIIQIENIFKNLPMTRHNTAVDKELSEDLPQELWVADRVWVHRGGTHGPFTTAPTLSSSWATGRITSPPPGSSPAAPPSPWQSAPGPTGNRP